MKNMHLSCEVIYTDDLYFKAKKHENDKKRKGLVIFFICITVLIGFLILRDIFTPNNKNGLYGVFFFMPFLIISFLLLLKTRTSTIKKQVINNRDNLVFKNNYFFNDEHIIIEGESSYSKTYLEYKYNAITNIEKVDNQVFLIYFKDKRAFIIQSDNSLDIYNYVCLKTKNK